MPLYEHDCNECVYLGELDGSDLYYHPDSGPLTETVIARHSSDGPDYTSGMVFSKPYIDIAEEEHYGIPELVEARLRAEAGGLIRAAV